MTERMKSGTDLPSRNRERISRYATAAQVAAAIPTAILAANADATIYSQTGLDVTISNGSTAGAAQTFQITGAAGAPVGVVSAARRTLGGGLASFAYVAPLNGTGAGLQKASFRTLMNRTVTPGGSSRWFGGLPVSAGATWSNVGRAVNEFKGNQNAFGTDRFGNVIFGAAPFPSFNADPQNLGNTGDTWHLLFQFTGGAASGNYGWISFTANVVGVGNASITFTGWGWDDSGARIGAGVTASAVPGGTGLAALAFGAAGLRGRRRRR